MLRRELLVEVKHDQIVVRVTGTSYAISYYRIASSSGLAARNLPARDDHRAPMSRLESQYLIGLAKATSSIGARVFEETRVTGVEESELATQSWRSINPRQERGVGDQFTDCRPLAL